MIMDFWNFIDLRMMLMMKGNRKERQGMELQQTQTGTWKDLQGMELFQTQK